MHRCWCPAGGVRRFREVGSCQQASAKVNFPVSLSSSRLVKLPHPPTRQRTKFVNRAFFCERLNHPPKIVKNFAGRVYRAGTLLRHDPGPRWPFLRSTRAQRAESPSLTAALSAHLSRLHQAHGVADRPYRQRRPGPVPRNAPGVPDSHPPARNLHREQQLERGGPLRDDAWGGGARTLVGVFANRRVAARGQGG